MKNASIKIYGEEIRIEDRLAGNENVDIENVHVIRSCIKRSKIEDTENNILKEKGYTQKEIGKILRQPNDNMQETWKIKI